MICLIGTVGISFGRDHVESAPIPERSALSARLLLRPLGSGTGRRAVPCAGARVLPSSSLAAPSRSHRSLPRYPRLLGTRAYYSLYPDQTPSEFLDAATQAVAQDACLSHTNRQGKLNL